MTRYALFGTSEIAAAVLVGLCNRGKSPALVITPPDRKQGRGRKLSECATARVGREHAIPVLKAEDVNAPASRAEIVEAADGLALLCDFGQIISAGLLAELLILNLHPSLLPRWRGAAPIERAIMAGDSETGVCVMRLEEGLDTGPVTACERTEIRAGETYGQLSGRLADIGVELAGEALESARAGTLEFAPQPESGVTYAAKVEKAERRLDPSRPAKELERVVRALDPHIGTFIELAGGERLGVESAAVLEEGAGFGATGALEVKGEAIVLNCAEGALRLDRVKPPGGRTMAAAEFVRGRGLPGDHAV